MSTLLEGAEANILVERLVSAVGRAFYTDPVIVVLDTLIRERSCRSEELSPRLRLTEKETRKILNLLEDEKLISSEDLTDEKGKVSKYYYIDYQWFVNIVRYRVALMQKKVSSSEKYEFSIPFQCPTCKTKYQQLEATKYLSLDKHFICPTCCPFDDFRNNNSEVHYRLVEVDNRESLHKYSIISEKIKNQLCKKEGLRDGIFELLKQLKDRQLIRNLPSENRKRGINASKIVDDDVKRDLMNTKVTNKEHIKRAGNIKTYVMGQEISGINLSITDDSNNNNNNNNNNNEQNNKRQRDNDNDINFNRTNEYYEGMDHLRGSRVRTGNDLKRQQEQDMQYYDSLLNGNDQILLNDNENEKKKMKMEAWDSKDQNNNITNNNNNNNNNNVKEDKSLSEDEEEDIDWET
jgi:transcription initiation factor IIE alpha subunit